MNAQTQVNELDFDGEGWHIKVGQVYSSPYEADHFLVTHIELDEKDRDDARIHFNYVDSRDYSKVFDGDYWHRAWWVNDGNWDLERDVELEEST